MSRSTELYRSRRAAGLCGRCGATPEPGKSRCGECLERAREAGARRYASHVAAGICVVCSDRASHGIMCAKHRDRRIEYIDEYLAAKRTSGECLRCRLPAEPGHALCPGHIEADRRENEIERVRGKASAERDRRARYRAQGLCPRCGESPAPGRLLCPVHLEKQRLDSRRARQRKGPHP